MRRPGLELASISGETSGQCILPQVLNTSQTAQTVRASVAIIVLNYLGKGFFQENRAQCAGRRIACLFYRDFRAIRGTICMTHPRPSANGILSSILGLTLTILCGPLGFLCFIGAAASGGSVEGTIILAGLGLVFCAISVCAIVTAWDVLGGRVSAVNHPRVAHWRS
jgi:hypothetical protein